MHNFNIQLHLTTLFISFLNNPSQYVCVDSTNYYFIGLTNAGTPQGTLSGPVDFKLLINDLTFDQLYIKYVDDTTAATVSSDSLDNSLQTAADKFHNCCIDNKMFVNASKSK